MGCRHNSPLKRPKVPLPLHLGKEPKPVWKIVNVQAGPSVCILGDIRSMSQFADESV